MYTSIVNNFFYIIIWLSKRHVHIAFHESEIYNLEDKIHMSPLPTITTN